MFGGDQMMISRKVAVVVSIIGIAGLVTLYGCATQPGAAPMPAEQVAAEKPSVTSPEYEIKVKPLTTAECGQCHASIFETIKAQGAKHQSS
jgi:hypothetical protein